MSEIKYPHINVVLQDSNGFSITAVVANAMKTMGVPSKEILQYRKEALSGDYNHLLNVTMNWVNISLGFDEDGE